MLPPGPPRSGWVQQVAGANRRWRCQFRYRGSRRESAVAQLFSLDAENGATTLGAVQRSRSSVARVGRLGGAVFGGKPVFRLTASSRLAESLARWRVQIHRDGTRPQAERRPCVAECSGKVWSRLWNCNEIKPAVFGLIL